MAEQLTPKMAEALEYIDAYGNAGPFKNRTLDALVDRGLIDGGSHGLRGGVAWDFRVTVAGAEVYSATQRKHLNGRFTVQARPAVDVKLYDERRAEAMHVLGQGRDLATGEQLLFFRYENDDHGPHAPQRYVTFVELRDLSRFSAVCPHRYPNQGEQCPTCNPLTFTYTLTVGSVVFTAKAAGLEIRVYLGEVATDEHLITTLTRTSPEVVTDAAGDTWATPQEFAAAYVKYEVAPLLSAGIPPN